MIKVSVIMPVYNESLSYLNESITSIEKQTYKNFEFIIVDDNPKSVTIKKYLLYKRYCDNRIKLIFNRRNIGAMLSSNEAIKKAKGVYIAKMDADDISLPNRLRAQLNFCNRYNLDFSCCNLRGFTSTHINKKNIIPNITQTNQKKIRCTMSYVNIAIGPALFFKRRIIDKIGMYRNIVCEDYDLSMRALVHNYKVGYLSAVLIYKRIRLNNISTANLLQEFVSGRIISKYTRYNNFNKVIPLIYLKRRINSISKYNIRKYQKFLKNSVIWNKTKSVKSFIKKYYYALSSLFMLRLSLFTYFTKIIQAIFLK